MELQAGTRIRSAVSDVEIIVVVPPAEPVALSCGGAPMISIDDEPSGGDVDPSFAEPTPLGKRYVDQVTNLEVLCTKGGDGVLVADDRPLTLKDAKPLPSSD